jgi:hypothetical protein
MEVEGVVFMTERYSRSKPQQQRGAGPEAAMEPAPGTGLAPSDLGCQKSEIENSTGRPKSPR